MMNASMLSFTSGWRIIQGPSAAVMFRAPNLWGAGAPLHNRVISIVVKVLSHGNATHDRSTWLMNPRIGIKVALVRLLAKENKNVVAAETGVAKFSYSSEGRRCYKCTVGRGNDIKRTDCNPNVVNRIILPQSLLSRVKGELREDERRDKSLEAGLEQSPRGLGLDAVKTPYLELL